MEEIIRANGRPLQSVGTDRYSNNGADLPSAKATTGIKGIRRFSSTSIIMTSTTPISTISTTRSHSMNSMKSPNSRRRKAKKGNIMKTKKMESLNNKGKGKGKGKNKTMGMSTKGISG